MRRFSVLMLALVLCAPALLQAQARQPRQLSAEQLAKLRTSVQKSKVRNAEAMRQAEIRRQEAARQLEESLRMAEAEAARQAEEEEWEDDPPTPAVNPFEVFANTFNSEMAKYQAEKEAQDAFVRNIQRQQAEAARRQREQQAAQERTERQRQVQLINQANQRQDDEAARLAAQHKQYEQQRADAQAAERAEAQRRDEQLKQQAAAERQRLQDQQEKAVAAAASSIRSSPPSTNGCRVVRPKLNDTLVTGQGEVGGEAKLRERAANTCQSFTGNPAFSADVQCTADGPYVHHCALKGQCAGEERICGPEQ